MQFTQKVADMKKILLNCTKRVSEHQNNVQTGTKSQELFSFVNFTFIDISQLLKLD